MATVAIPENRASSRDTVADLLKQLGDISPRRILMQPPLGTATEKDVVKALEAADKRLCELVDGVLVEKIMGYREGIVAGVLLQDINTYLDKHDLGVASGPDGPVRLMAGLVRIPDVSYASWERLGGEVPKVKVPDLVPELAVEVVSEGNTPKEMKRKLEEYFSTGVDAVWMIYTDTQTAEVYSSPVRKRHIARDQALNGGKLLPGFSVTLKRLFARLNRKRSS